MEVDLAGLRVRIILRGANFLTFIARLATSQYAIPRASRQRDIGLPSKTGQDKVAWEVFPSELVDMDFPTSLRHMRTIKKSGSAMH